MKRIYLPIIFINLCIAMFGMKPSLIPLFNSDLLADTIEMDDLIGDTIKFLKTKNGYNDFVDNVSPYLYNIYPDTIIVHQSKKPLIEDIDYFVLRKYESVLEYRDKKSGYYFYEFNVNDYNQKKFKRYEFRIKENNPYSYDGVYSRYFIIKNIKSTNGNIEYVLKDLSKTSNNDVLFCPPKYTKISIVSNYLNALCRRTFPSKLYVKSDYGGYNEKKRSTIEAQINVYNNRGVIDIDALYGMSYDKISISKLNNALTEDEYQKWDKKYTIDYSVNPYHIVDTSLVESIAGEGRTGILIKFKGTCFSQNIHRDDLTNKVYNSDESLFWFAGIDTINNKIYYRVCENDKVFWIRERDAEFNEIESCTSIKKNWSNLTDKQKEYYFDYTKYFVCHKLHQEHINEWFELMNKYKSIGILLENCKIYGDEYSTGFEVKVTNMSNKTIKYIIFNIVGLNSVKDKVKYKGTYIQETRGIGPISPLETAYYDFEHLWWTDIVEYFDIQSINIEYTDGTKKQITDWKSARKSWLIELQEKKLNYAPELKTNVKW